MKTSIIRERHHLWREVSVVSDDLLLVQHLNESGNVSFISGELWALSLMNSFVQHLRSEYILLCMIRGDLFVVIPLYFVRIISYDLSYTTMIALRALRAFVTTVHAPSALVTTVKRVVGVPVSFCVFVRDPTVRVSANTSPFFLHPLWHKQHHPVHSVFYWLWYRWTSTVYTSSLYRLKTWWHKMLYTPLCSSLALAVAPEEGL